MNPEICFLQQCYKQYYDRLYSTKFEQIAIKFDITLYNLNLNILHADVLFTYYCSPFFCE